MESSRQLQIEIAAGDGDLKALMLLLEPGYSQLEIDTALENAIAYAQIPIAEYLLSLGADLSNYDYQGIRYAVCNNELEGLRFAISKGVDINVNEGMLLHESIITAMNEKDTRITKWLLENGANPACWINQHLACCGDMEALN